MNRLYDRNMVELRAGQTVRGARYLSEPRARLQEYDGVIESIDTNHNAVLVRLDDGMPRISIYRDGYGIGSEGGGDLVRICIGYDYNKRAFVGRSFVEKYGSRMEEFIEVSQQGGDL